MQLLFKLWEGDLESRSTSFSSLRFDSFSFIFTTYQLLLDEISIWLSLRFDLFTEDFVESAPSWCKVEIKDANIRVLVLWKQCECPDAPEEVVEEAAV